MTASAEPVGLPRLHLVTNEAIVTRPGFGETARALMGAGGGEVAFHLRGRSLSGREMWDAAEVCAAAAEASGSALIVNDRIDIARGCGARGVQLGRSSIAVADARALLGPDRWIGASVHEGAEARMAQADGADFVLAGTLYPSASHPGRPGAGPGLIEAMVEVAIPIVGIGGVTPERVGEVRGAGAAGVAVITGIWDAPSPVAALERYLSELE